MKRKHNIQIAESIATSISDNDIPKYILYE